MSAYRDDVARWMRGLRLGPSAPQWKALRDAMAATSGGSDAALAAAVEQVRAALGVGAKGRLDSARDDLGAVLSDLPARWTESIPGNPGQQRIAVRAALAAAASTLPAGVPDGREWVASVSRARGMLGPVLSMLAGMGEPEVARKVTAIDGDLALAASMADGATSVPRAPDPAAPTPAPKRQSDETPPPKSDRDRRTPDNGPIRKGGPGLFDFLSGPGWLPVIVGAGVALATDSPGLGIAAGGATWYYTD